MSEGWKRREGLGRNRGVTIRRGVTVYHWLFVAIAAVGFFSWRYFSEPHRVYASRTFDCSPWEIAWTQLPDGRTEVTGCRRTAYVMCDDRGCSEEP